MKKLFLIGIILSAVSASAQESRLKLGIIGGPNLTLFFANDYNRIAIKPRVSYAAGITLDYRLKNRLSLTTGLLSEKKIGYNDFSYTDEFGNPTDIGFRSYYKLSNISVPLAIKLDIINQKIKISGLLGSQIQYLSKQEQTDFNSTNYQLINGTENYNKLNLDLITGIGASIKINSSFDLSLEVRNNLGITNMHKYGVLKTNTTNLLLGLSYQL